MPHFTKEMKQRLKDQGWEFFQMDYWDFPNIDFQLFEANIYLNHKYPGVCIKETAFGDFVIYSDVEYKIKDEKFYDTYINGYYRGYNQGYSNGYKIAKIKNPLNFFQRAKRKIKQTKEILWHILQRK